MVRATVRVSVNYFDMNDMLQSRHADLGLMGCINSGPLEFAARQRHRSNSFSDIST